MPSSSYTAKRDGRFMWRGEHVGTLTKSVKSTKAGSRPTTVYLYKPLRGKKGKGIETACNSRRDLVHAIVSDITRAERDAQQQAPAVQRRR